jgi:heterodisulfide reductase subunit C
MDYTPTTLLRLMQLQTPDADKKILRSYSIWLCLTCHTCIARCPMEVDLPKVMDVLREESLRKNLVHLKGKQIVAFHKSFIDAIRLNGRLWEIGLIGEFKMRSLRLLQDIALVPSMLMKGKLSLMPPGKKSLVNRIFNNLHLLKERA